MKMKALRIPPRFDYRLYTKDKMFLKSEKEAGHHFDRVGLAKGIAGSTACNTGNFKGSNVYYFDVKSREELQKRYAGEPGESNVPKKITM